MINTDSKLVKFLGKYGIVILILLIIFAFSLISDTFLKASTFGNIIISNIATAILALGAFFILVVNEFDLSLGYNIMLSMAVGGRLNSIGASAPVCIISMLLTGLLFGYLNGYVVVKLKVSAFITTLSSGLLMYGLTQIITGGTMLRLDLGQAWMTFAQGKVAEIGYCVIFWVALCIIVYYFTSHTRTGRNMYAVGDSPKTAYLAGINTGLIRMLAFSLAGLFAAAAGVVYVGQVVSASAQYGASLLLPAYSMVFISSVAIKPGTFNIPGLLLAILFVSIGSSGITIVGAPTWVSYVFEGSILLIAVLLFNTFRPKSREEIESTLR